MENFVDFNKAVENYNGSFKDLINTLSTTYSSDLLGDTLVSINDEELNNHNTGKCLTVTVKLNDKVGYKAFYQDTDGDIVNVFAKVGPIENIDDNNSLRSTLRKSGYNMSLSEDIKIGDFDRGEMICTMSKSEIKINNDRKFQSFVEVINLALKEIK